MIMIKIHYFHSGIQRFLYKGRIFIVENMKQIPCTRIFHVDAKSNGTLITLFLKEIRRDKKNRDHYFSLEKNAPAVSL